MSFSQVTFGSLPPDSAPLRIYAYSYLDGKARVFSMPDTPEGYQELAGLIRAEVVLRAVLGVELVCTEQHVVAVRGPQGDFHDRYQKTRD